MDENLSDPKLRVLLWTTPRSLATVFTKCMSYAEGVQIIKEPLVTARSFGPENEVNEMKDTFAEGISSIPDSQSISVTSAYDDNIATLKWSKALLESSFPNKSFVFVHDQAICLNGDFAILPRGYTHTFLIRNPYRLFPSWKKTLMTLLPSFKDKPFSDLPKPLIGTQFGYGELFDLMEHAQNNLGQKPIVIDADDLQTDPGSVLKQYCHLLGLKFNESMLKWKEGDEIVDTWIAGKTILQGNKMEKGGFYEDAFRSTRFHPPKELPPRDEIDSDLLQLIDQSMPIYEKMYKYRIQP